MDELLKQIDTRVRAAVYSTCRNKKDSRAVELLHAFCAVNSLRCSFYLDKVISKDGSSAVWLKLLDDVSQGKFDVVLTWLDLPEMAKWCALHNTRFEQVDIFLWSQAIRTSNTDMMRQY